MKRILAAILAMMMLCGAALASEAPAIPQEADTPLEMLLDGILGGDDEAAPALPEPEAEEQRPAIEVTKFKCSSKGVLEIDFRNNLDVTVEGFTYFFVTYNADGTYSPESANKAFRDSYKETFNYIWEYGDKSLKSGKTVTLEHRYSIDNGVEEVDINTKRHDVIAVGVRSYILETGEVFILASDQIVFRTTEGNVIPAVADSLEPQVFPEDKEESIAPVSLGLVQYDLPVFACEYYGMPAGQHVERVLAGSPAKSAGIRQGDVILSFNGMRASLPHADKYCRLWMLENGSVEVTYWRRGEILTTTFVYNK